MKDLLKQLDELPRAGFAERDGHPRVTLFIADVRALLESAALGAPPPAFIDHVVVNEQGGARKTPATQKIDMRVPIAESVEAIARIIEPWRDGVALRRFIHDELTRLVSVRDRKQLTADLVALSDEAPQTPAAAPSRSTPAPQMKVQRDVVMTAIRTVVALEKINLGERAIDALTQGVVEAYSQPAAFPAVEATPPAEALQDSHAWVWSRHCAVLEEENRRLRMRVDETKTDGRCIAYSVDGFRCARVRFHEGEHRVSDLRPWKDAAVPPGAAEAREPQVIFGTTTVPSNHPAQPSGAPDWLAATAPEKEIALTARVAASLGPVISDLERVPPRQRDIRSSIYVLKNLKRALEDSVAPAGPRDATEIR